MHTASRGRAEEDVRVLENALAALDGTTDRRSPTAQRALEDLRALHKRKEDSLEAPPIDRMTTSSQT